MLGGERARPKSAPAAARAHAEAHRHLASPPLLTTRSRPAYSRAPASTGRPVTPRAATRRAPGAARQDRRAASRRRGAAQPCPRAAPRPDWRSVNAPSRRRPAGWRGAVRRGPAPGAPERSFWGYGRRRWNSAHSIMIRRMRLPRYPTFSGSSSLACLQLAIRNVMIYPQYHDSSQSELAVKGRIFGGGTPAPLPLLKKGGYV